MDLLTLVAILTGINEQPGINGKLVRPDLPNLTRYVFDDIGSCYL